MFFFYLFTLFKRLCAPLPKSNVQTFQIFGILGEKKYKQVVSVLKTFAYKACKITSQKQYVFRQILPYYQDFFGIGATIRIVREMLCLRMRDFFLTIAKRLISWYFEHQFLKCFTIAFFLKNSGGVGVPIAKI